MSGTIPEGAPYASLIEDEPPPGSDVHTIPNTVSWERDDIYRTILVTRTDGSRWYCRAILPSRISPKTTEADIVSQMPDGQTFCTGYYVVDRNDPTRYDWIMATLRVEWSKSRDLVFFFEYNRLIAFGTTGLLWKIVVPDADYEQNLLFDFITEGALRLIAQQAEPDTDGNPVFMSYAIDIRSGTIVSQWPVD